MKKPLLAALCCFAAFFCFAQTPVKTIAIKGVVIDSAANKPIDFATAAITGADKKPIKSTLTKTDGSFELKIPAGTGYQLSIIYVGYRTKTISVKGDADSDAGRILLSASTNQLKEVAVSALKPLAKQEVDRISYDVQADPESKSLTALDMMRKVPLLSVDASDVIKLRGDGNFKILLNGKESALLANNPADVLKSMPGTTIVKIEVITSPPAKYDAEGFAGIINIITQKKADQGYNGSINSNVNDVNGARINLNATVKQGKLGFNIFTGANDRRLLTSEFDNSTSFINPASRIYQTGDRGNKNRNAYAGTELSFEIDTLNLLTGTFNIYNNKVTSVNNQVTNLYDGANALTQTYAVNNNGTNNPEGVDAALNYQLGFKHHKDELLTVSYKYSYNNSKQFNDVLTSQTGAPNYRQYNNAGGKEYTTQLDYILPMKTLTVEAGGKMILRDNFSIFYTDTQNGAGAYITAPALTNDFTYQQDVYSAYNSYTVKLTKWVFKGGLRLERTDIDAAFVNSPGFSRFYNNLVPSFSMQRVLKNSSLTFGFTQRIQRPGIMQLNPFINSSNPLYITIGNPNLTPALNNNFELSYGNYHKGSLNISTNYTFSNNTIQQISTVNGNITTDTYANTGKSRRLGFDVNLNYPITRRMNVNINAELQQVWLDGFYNGKEYTNSGQQGHMFTYTSYKFDNGIRLGMNIGFDSRYVLLQGRDNYYFGNGLIISRDFFNNKATIGLSATGPFQRYNKLDFITKTNDFYTYSSNQNLYRTFGLTFNYKFGKLNAQIKKNQRGINNDDAAGGRN